MQFTNLESASGKCNCLPGACIQKLHTCIKCGCSKGFLEFPRDNTRQKCRIKVTCKACSNADQRLRNKLRREWEQDNNKSWVELEGESCPICLEKMTLKGKKRAVLDHCHSSKTFRGVICDVCNVSLGHFKDDLEVVNRAYLYLKGKYYGKIN